MPLLVRVIAAICGIGLTACAFLFSFLVAAIQVGDPPPAPIIMEVTAIGFGLGFGYWTLAVSSSRTLRLNKILPWLTLLSFFPLVFGYVYLIIATGSFGVRIGCGVALLVTVWLSWKAINEPRFAA